MRHAKLNLVPAIPAPEFKNISIWANSEPVSVKGLKGKVILLDCWTYTCIFCLRTIPIMKRLQQKYAKNRFQVIQAHSAEYDFAKDASNIQRAIMRYNINNIPVAFDTDNRIWEAYGNMYWPKHVLIDHNGFIRYGHAGYGEIQDFEDEVVELLEEAGQKPDECRDSENPTDEIFDTYGMHYHGIAPEISVGYSRLRRFGNNQTMKADEPNIVMDSGSHDYNLVYLRGKWIWERECVRFCSDGKQKDPAIIVKYDNAKRVHGIIGTSDGKVGKVEVKLDGDYLTEKYVGKDVRIKNGISFVEVRWSFMHNLISTQKPEIHEIEIIPRSENFKFYTFVFG
jgi:thiol-disulfide isomerase/thioredoxin